MTDLLVHKLAEEAALPRTQLDVDYNARATVTVDRFDEIMAQANAISQKALAHYATFKDVIYDELSQQKLDISGTVAGELRPAFIFIHGGYWKALSKEESSFMAGFLQAHQVASVAVEYTLAPHASLREIVRQIRASIAYLWQHGREHGIDPNRLYVGGSSAGGHLAGCVIAGGWQAEFNVPDNVIKAALPLSGLFHLAPIANCFAQEWLNLTSADVKALSPAENLSSQGCPIIVAYAECEAAGFKRQSIDYHQSWLDAGFKSEIFEIKGRNHFDIVLDLADPDSLLGQALLRLIAGNPS